MATVVAGLVAGAFWVGHLQGRIDELDPEAISKARAEALDAIRHVRGGGWSAPAFSNDGMSMRIAANGEWHIRPLGLGADEGICWLSEVTGKFEGDGERLRIVQRDGRWILEGHFSQPGGGTAAHCWRFPWAPPPVADPE